MQKRRPLPNQNKSNNKISLVDYVAFNNTAEARRLIVKFGQMPAKNISELRTRLAKVIMDFKGDALKEIAKIHPDRALITEFNKITGENRRDGYSYNKGNKDDLNFVTNMRAVGNDADADGASSERMATSKWKPSAENVLVILAIFALGAMVVSAGEKQRSYR